MSMLVGKHSRLTFRSAVPRSKLSYSRLLLIRAIEVRLNVCLFRLCPFFINIMSLNIHQLQLKERFTVQRGYWDGDWEAVLKLQPAYFEAYLNIRDTSQHKTRLTPKVQEFIYLAVAASTTHIHVPGVRAHVKAAIALGATPDEIMEVIGLTYLVGIHTVTLGAPILQELIEELGIESDETESRDLEKDRARIKESFIKQRGFWTDTWNPLLELDPHFFAAYTEFSSLPSKTNVLEPKVRELVTCAFDAATTHLYGRGTKIHMRNALQLGATPGEIMEMLEITSLMGIHGVTVSASVLLDEISTKTNGVH